MLAASCDVVFLCVSRDQDVLEIIDKILPTLLPGTLVIDLSTVSQKTAEIAAHKIRSVGADFLDAPVTGGVEGARQGMLVIMTGGTSASLERAKPMLASMSRNVIHMGDVGMGQAAKAVNQIMCAGINEAVTESLAFAEHLGLDMEKIIEITQGGAAGNWFLEKRGPTMIKGTFAPGFKVQLHHKDLLICLEMAKTNGIKLPLTEMTESQYATLIQEGHGEEDISSLYRLKKRAS
jgi:3-hydroxyisobutyrate dehydrogenase